MLFLLILTKQKNLLAFDFVDRVEGIKASAYKGGLLS